MRCVPSQIDGVELLRRLQKKTARIPVVIMTGHADVPLAVAAMKGSSEIERILSHTRWQSQVVHSIHDAKQVLRSLPISVVLCENRLPDGTWLDVMGETEQYGRRPQVIVLSASADFALWEEVHNRGGYALLATPLEAREVYALVEVTIQ